MSKRGAVDELVKIIVIIVVLLVMVTAVIVLYKVGGGKILDSIKNIFRFGR